MTSPRIAQRRAANTARIVEAALAAFAEQGYERTTTVQIADTLGMTGPSLYHYFPTKDSLLFACIEFVMGDLLETLRSASRDGADPVARLSATVKAQVLFELRVGTVAQIVNGHLYGPKYLTSVLSDEQRSTVRQLQRDVIAVYRALLEEAVAAGAVSGEVDLKLAAFNVLAIAQYTPVWLQQPAPRRAREVAEAQSRQVLAMLGIAGTAPGR
jgi:AcrR family transcriptional regulator